MKQEFRDRVLKIGEKGLEIMEEYFQGTRVGTDKVTEATKMIGLAVKIEHMNQLKDQGDKSIALRLIKYLPQDKDLRVKYIKMTNPEIGPLLLARPQKR